MFYRTTVTRGRTLKVLAEEVFEGRSPSQKGLVPAAVVQHAQNFGQRVHVAAGGEVTVMLATTTIAQVGISRAGRRHENRLAHTVVAWSVGEDGDYERLPGPFVADRREWWG